jgi:hypothetical protein
MERHGDWALRQTDWTERRANRPLPHPDVVERQADDVR